MGSKRILHTTNDFSFNGTGHTLSTLELVLGQVQSGHRVTVACLESDSSMRDLLDEFGVELIELVSWKKLALNRKTLKKFRKVIHSAGIVHVHTGKSMIAAFLASPIHFLRSSVSTVHNPHQHSTRLLYCARQVVALSPVQVEDIRRQTFGLVKATSIPNGTLQGLRTSYPFDRDHTEVPPFEPNSVLFVGGLYPRKGLDVLLKAVSKVHHCGIEANLYVIGNRDNPSVEELAEQLGIGRYVHFLGFKKDPITYMANADLFVLPSREEGFGNVLVEARAARVPIIASNVGGIPSALSGGRAGVLVPPEDVDGLATQISKVLSDAKWAKELRARTSDGIEEFFVSRFVKAYDDVYQKVVRTGQKRD